MLVIVGLFLSLMVGMNVFVRARARAMKGKTAYLNLNLAEFSTLNLIKEIIRVNPKLVLELGALAASIR